LDKVAQTFLDLSWSTDYPLPFSPCTEIGSRPAFEHWGKEYAQEERLLTYAFEKLRLEEVVSVTAVYNRRSCRVMEGIGMTYDSQGDLDHPNLDRESPAEKTCFVPKDEKRVNLFPLNELLGGRTIRR
jgi:RimJ/RimL family protein N-acetyltransferase